MESNRRMSVFLTWLVTEYMSVGPKGLMARFQI